MWNVKYKLYREPWNSGETEDIRRHTDPNQELESDMEEIHVTLTVLYLEICFQDRNKLLKL